MACRVIIVAYGSAGIPGNGCTLGATLGATAVISQNFILIISKL